MTANPAALNRSESLRQSWSKAGFISPEKYGLPRQTRFDTKFDWPRPRADGPARNFAALHIKLAEANADAHLDKIFRLPRASGVGFAGNVNKRYARQEPMPGAARRHAEGARTDQGDQLGKRRVAPSVVPDVGNVMACQVEDEWRFDALSGFESLAFARPARLPAKAPWRVGVKVIDPRGNEGLRVITMAPQE